VARSLIGLNFRFVFNSVVFFGLFGVVPTVCCTDEIQKSYRRAFYPAFCKSPCSTAYLFTLCRAWRGLVGGLLRRLCVAPD
ncbi:MAG: hypothetical protein IJP68_05285, partial [Selenomonadaceae bacterium]|nr:hypothetical protein [Selenomonadaceae bacterium]